MLIYIYIYIYEESSRSIENETVPKTEINDAFSSKYSPRLVFIALIPACFTWVEAPQKLLFHIWNQASPMYFFNYLLRSQILILR